MLSLQMTRPRSLVLMMILVLCGIGWTTAALQEPPDGESGMTPRLQRLMDEALGDAPFRKLFEEALNEGRPFPIPPGLMNRLMGSAEGQELLEEVNRRFFDPRKHEPSRFERQNKEQLHQFLPVVRKSPTSAYPVLRGDKQLALATVVESGGWLVSKASELQRTPLPSGADGESTDATAPPAKEDPSASLPLELRVGSRRVAATIVAVDEKYDLALLRADDDSLGTPIWRSSEPQIGDFVITPNGDGQVATAGVISVGVRSLLNADKGFLGVQLDPDARGAVVADVVMDSAASSAGVAPGDRVLTVDGEKINSLTHMINTISKRSAGDTVELELRRGQRELKLAVVLGGRTISGEQARQFNLMSSLGAELSRRRGLFPAVLQHDSQLYPEMAGGPLLDLDGNVVGVNIARSGRVESYAIPAATVSRMARELRRKAEAK